MSNRAAPVPTLIVGITIVAITMVVIAGCAGAPETASTAVTPPETERESTVPVTGSGDAERRPDAGTARVTAVTPVIDVALPLPVIAENEAPEIGLVEPGLVVPIPDSPPRRVMRLEEPELPPANEPVSAGDLKLLDEISVADDPEPPDSVGVAGDVESLSDAAPPPETEQNEYPEPPGGSQPNGPSAVAAGPAPITDDVPAADTVPIDSQEEPLMNREAANRPEPPEAAAADVIDERDRFVEPISPREEPRSTASEWTETELTAVQENAVSETAPRTSQEPQTTRNTRIVSAAREIEVRLPGVSWLFLGSEPPVTFLGRETDQEADETLFRFRVSEAAQLRFEAQDLVSGTRTRHEETVQIAADDREDTTAANTVAHGDVTARSGQATETPRRSNDDGSDEMTQSSEGSNGPDGGDELMYLDYLGAAERPFDPDHHAAIVTAISEEDDALHDVSFESLLSYADRVRDHGNTAAARDVLGAMWGTHRMKSDEVLYRLARLAETEGPTRDLKRSRELYSELVDRYPFSVYYRDSEERIRFLNRHFFHIR